MRNLAAALAHYSALGFDASAYADGDEYGFANREGIGLATIPLPARPAVEQPSPRIRKPPPYKRLFSGVRGRSR